MFYCLFLPFAFMTLSSSLATTKQPNNPERRSILDQHQLDQRTYEEQQTGSYDSTQLSDGSSIHNDNDYFSPEKPNTNSDSIQLNYEQEQFRQSNSFELTPPKEFLTNSVAERACRMNRGCERQDSLNNTYLSHCTRYKLETLFSTKTLMSIMHDPYDSCYNILDTFIQLDESVERYDSAFRNLLRRYNCHNGYSVKWTCEDCKKAYKDWLCATNLPYYMKGERVKPCISFCERVEQRCPYLHPITKEQYGGQPVFICRDPNIPFVKEITPNIPYSEPSKCYDLCHLNANTIELITDTLSKYEHNKCPAKGSVAEEVRRDPQDCQLDLQANDSNKHTRNQYDSNPISDKR